MHVWNTISFKRIFKRSPIQIFTLIVCITALCLCTLSFTRFDALQHIKLLTDQQMFVLEGSYNDKPTTQQSQSIEFVRHLKPKVKQQETSAADYTNDREMQKKTLNIKGSDRDNEEEENIYETKQDKEAYNLKGALQEKNNVKDERNRKNYLHESNEDIDLLKKGEELDDSKMVLQAIKKDKDVKNHGLSLPFKESFSLNPNIKAAKILTPQQKVEEKSTPINRQNRDPDKSSRETRGIINMQQISMEEALSRFRYKASKECINECPKTKDDNPFSYSSLCNLTTQAKWSNTLQQAEAEVTPFLEEHEYVYPYEREYLRYAKTSDPSFLPNAKKSQVKFQTFVKNGKISTVTCRLGETITARLDLVDGAGRPRTSGGDEVRAWIGATHAHNGSVINSMYPRSMAPVTDLNNGSYRVDVKCLWTGRSRLVITIQYPREFLRMVVEFVRKGGSRFIGSRFENSAASEVVPCLATPNVPGRPCICNLTKLNGGAPFYCARPLDPRLTCDDWVISGTMTRVTPSDFAAAEGKFAMKRQENRIPTDHIVIITEPLTSRSGVSRDTKSIDSGKQGNPGYKADSQEFNLFMPPASNPCKESSPKITWAKERPTGYWLDNTYTWVSLLCKETMVTKPWLQACLKDSSVWIIGDSNGVRLYYKVADSLGLARLDYGPMPFFDAIARSNRRWNTKVHFSPHENPLYVTKQWKHLNVEFIGVPDKIDAIPSEGRQFLIIHYFLHMTTAHLGVAYGRLVAARDAIIRLLERNPQAVVGIRGPHTVSLNAIYNIAIGGDSLARHLIDIIREVFKDLQDRVLFLDGWETSLSVESYGIHPMGPVVDVLNRRFFSFACDEDMGNDTKKL